MHAAFADIMSSGVSDVLALHHAFIPRETAYVMFALSKCINMHICNPCAGVAEEYHVSVFSMRHAVPNNSAA